MVEFALVLPVLLLIMFALIEAGRLLFYYSSVFTASREAARYGSAGGMLDDGSAFRYQDCAGMRASARRIGFFAIENDGQIEIKYDHGPSDSRAWSALPNCPSLTTLGDRVVVRVTTTYSPLVPMLNFTGFNVQSVTARTILKDIEVGGVYAPIPGGGGGGGATVTPTATTSGGGSSTATPTPTATTSGGGGSTPTATPTATPTPSPTPVYCDKIVRVAGPVTSGLVYSFSLRNDNTTNSTINAMTISWSWSGNPKLRTVAIDGVTVKSDNNGMNSGTTISTWNAGSNMVFGAGSTRSIVYNFSGGNSSSLPGTVLVSIGMSAGCNVSVP